ncbi:LysR family transcriptional regulator [Variovorax sp. NFACC27]|uniref:LysR substrate-binding domain-containing protein n=1 Tax=unclassified Variovorax TaxID=663243 RepID=UPI00089B8D86|nr:transcriptional regulator, LysR family [Variovorax sp. NFACC28]SEG82172.1 transcriptional regulator, LysR family [Variovorax sp. NFACC29]SFD08404.1 transcriptional regulator, LysR family [Variovorax sp. NFACC26]SFG19270.1 transcriptional regulator, LysR family [Variovorax sp. NFACC27]
MDRIDLLQVFVCVAETGSFTRAADRLGLPRASVSTAVQQLETRLGSRLLHRTTRRVGLTPDGEVMLERARALVADMEDVEQQFLPAHGQVSGRLKVDVPSRIARRLIAPALPEFFGRHPAIELELGSSDRAVDLVLEGVDCALRVGPMASSSLVARPLGHFTLINCASPAYLVRHGTPRTPADLPQHIAVNYASPTSGRAAPWEWLRDGEIATLRMRSQVAANNAETYIACALAGLGLIQIPAYDVREHLAAGELVEVLPDARAKPLPVQLVYPHRRNLSRRMQAFAGWLETVLADSLDRPAASASGRPRKTR